MQEIERGRVFNPLYRALLDGAERGRWQKPAEVIAALRLPRGGVVADIGAGTGYFTGPLSRSVGEQGVVFATEVQETMLRALEERIARERLHNVRAVRAAFDDPALPPASCDVAILANVLKEIDARPAYLRRLARTLRPAGRIAVVSFRPDARGFGPPRAGRLSEEQVAAEFGEAGLVLAERHDFLSRQYFLVFVREGAV